MLGASSSGEDISRELATEAASVYLCARSWQNPQWGFDSAPVGERGNLTRKPAIKSLHADGRVEFSDGSVSDDAVDCVMYCTGRPPRGQTAAQRPSPSVPRDPARPERRVAQPPAERPAGYEYNFPFLKGADAVAVDDNFVGPLFEDIFCPERDGLAFIGVPWKVVPFPQFQVQARLVARVFSGRGGARLPTRGGMLAACEEHARALEGRGTAKRHWHMQGMGQWEYNARLLRLCGDDEAEIPGWRVEMYRETGMNKRSRPEEYRDAWDDSHLISEALAEFEGLWRDMEAGVAR